MLIIDPLSIIKHNYYYHYNKGSDPGILFTPSGLIVYTYTHTHIHTSSILYARDNIPEYYARMGNNGALGGTRNDHLFRERFHLKVRHRERKLCRIDIFKN